jgi:hypothetical protein
MATDPSSPPKHGRPLGTSREYILDRLRREGHHSWLEAVENGRLSAFAVACELGWAQRPPTLTGEKAHQAKRRRHQLAEERLRPGRQPRQRPVDPSDITPTQEMELWLGASDSGSSFASEEERSAAWFRHRDRLMQLWARDGKRPVAWWQHESPAGLYYPGPDFERSTLYEWGLLAEGERAELLAYWRREFQKAQQPNFTHCAGAGQFLEGEAARAAHFRWADIPPALVEAWSVELQQRAKKEPAAETAIAGSNQ